MPLKNSTQRNPKTLHRSTLFFNFNESAGSFWFHLKFSIWGLKVANFQLEISVCLQQFAQAMPVAFSSQILFEKDLFVSEKESHQRKTSEIIKEIRCFNEKT